MNPNKRCFALLFFGVLLFALLLVCGRLLIASMYAGTAPAFLNKFIVGQATNPLGEYLSEFNRLWSILCAITLLPLLAYCLTPDRLRARVAAGASALAGVVFLSVLAGMWIAWSDSGIYKNWVERSFNSAKAIYRNSILKRPLLGESDVWVHESTREFQGVRSYLPELAYEGVTLAFGGQSAYLLGMDGTVLHKWHVNYDSLDSVDGFIPRSYPETYLYWHQARLLPNGDLIVLIDQYDKSPNGLALIKIDSHSNVSWVFPHHVHHDFSIDKHGFIYVIDHDYRNDHIKNLTLELPYQDDGIVILTPDGKQVDRISLLDAFAQSDFYKLFNGLKIDDGSGDYLHTNNVDVIGEGLNAFQPGRLLLSFRNISTIALLDMETRKIIWAKNGYWRRQHDPDLLENGNIMIFDNEGAWHPKRYARVIEFNPDTYEIIWEYPGNTGQRLYSTYRGRQQLLANGNILISEFESGRLLEITRSGQTVWEYSCPFRFEIDPEYLCNIVSARRYNPDDLNFEFNMGNI